MTEKELDSITKQDLDFLTNVIINHRDPSLESVPKLIDMCDTLCEKFGTKAEAEVCDMNGYYYVDAGFGSIEVYGAGSIDIEDSRLLVKYLKEHGSGKYDKGLDDLTEEQEEDERLGRRYPYRIYLDFNFEEVDTEQLPSFLYFGEDKDGDIEVESIRNDIDCWGRLSSTYYYQP
jgi:hypothetical protein